MSIRPAVHLLAALMPVVLILAFSPLTMDSFLPLKEFFYFFLGAIALILLRQSLSPDREIPITAIDLAMLLLLLQAFFSSWLAIDGLLSTLTAFNLLPAAALYVLFRLAAGGGFWRVLCWLKWSLIPVLGYAFLQWIRMDPFLDVPDYFALSRIFSTLGNRNQLSYLLGMLLLSLLADILRLRFNWFRLISTGLTGGFFLLLGTRGAWLAFIVALPVAIISGMKIHRRCLYQRWLSVAALAVILALVGHLQGWNPAPPDELYRLAAADPNVSMRLELFDAAIQALAANPLTGIGVGCYPLFHASESGEQEFAVHATRVHNEYLQVGAELGLPGLFLLVFVIGSSCWVLRGQRVAGPMMIFLAVASLWSFPLQTAATGPLFLLLTARASGLEKPVIYWRPGALDCKILTIFLPLLALVFIVSATSGLTGSALLRQADMARRQGNGFAAWQFLELAHRLDGRNETVAFRLSGFRLDLENIAGAEDALECIRSRGEDPAVLRALAECRFRLEDPRGAEIYLHRALKRTRQMGPVFHALARARDEQGDRSGTISYLQAALRHGEKTALIPLLRRFLQQGERSSAVYLANRYGRMEDPEVRQLLWGKRGEERGAGD